MTTLARVAARRDLQGTADDALLSEFIAAVSQTTEERVSRHAQAAARTEVFRVDRFKRMLTLPGRPISTVTSIKVNYIPVFDTVTAADPSAYDILSDQGQVRLNWSLNYSPSYVEVVYTGGMAADTTSFIAAYPEVADAVDVEVVNRWNRRKSPGGETTTLGSATVSRTSAYGLHSHLRDAIRRYKVRRI